MLNRTGANDLKCCLVRIVLVFLVNVLGDCTPEGRNVVAIIDSILPEIFHRVNDWVFAGLWILFRKASFALTSGSQSLAFELRSWERDESEDRCKGESVEFELKHLLLDDLVSVVQAYQVVITS